LYAVFNLILCDRCAYILLNYILHIYAKFFDRRCNSPNLRGGRLLQECIPLSSGREQM